MNGGDKTSYIVAFIVAILIAGSAGYYKFVIEQAPSSPQTVPTVGKVGSAHAHASLLIMVNDRIINFCSPEFMLKSQYVHFENNDCFVVHRHATGVTIPTFLKTIGVELSSSCLTLATGAQYCAQGDQQLRTMINGKEIPIADLPYYEFKNNDHILINYGPEVGSALRFKYNQVPPIPENVNEPINTSPFGKVLNEPQLQNVK